MARWSDYEKCLLSREYGRGHQAHIVAEDWFHGTRSADELSSKVNQMRHTGEWELWADRLYQHPEICELMLVQRKGKACLCQPEPENVYSPAYLRNRGMRVDI